jgi:RimJ/RimL family protein N-acetyltransferase
MLKGEKVILRAIEREDLERLHAINNNLAVELAGGGDPPMPQSMARLMAEYDSNASHGGRDDAGFAIEVDGMLIGVCALFAFDNTAHTFELGITIGYPEYWGRGYGREAIQMLVNYGFHYRNAHKIWLRVHGVNERGQRAYTAVGFVEEGRLRQHVYSNGQYDDLIVMGILREEWLGKARGEA